MKGKKRSLVSKMSMFFVVLTSVLSCFMALGTTKAEAASLEKKIVGYYPVENSIIGYVNPDLTTSDSNVKTGFKVEITGSALYAITDNSGYFEIKNVPAEGYSLKISKVGYLDRIISNVVPNSQIGTTSQPSDIWAGDVVEDDVINMADVMEVAKAFNTINGDVKFNINVDFNKDNAINMNDIMIMVKHFNQTQLNYGTPVIITASSTPITATPTTTPTATPLYPVWDSTKIYTTGDKVTHNGNVWEAKWWTQGNEPGTASQQGVDPWKLIGPVIVITPTLTPTSSSVVTPTPVPSGNPAVRYSGRFDYSDPAGPKFAWTGSTITARFNGTGVSAKIKSLNSWQSNNWLQVKIDNDTTTKIQINMDGTYNLASGLTNGIHTVELCKRTEASCGALQFLGFDFGTGQLLVPPAQPSRHIEFIGDSITAGYGNEAPSQGSPFKEEEENGYMTYAAITARTLGADHNSICWSGKGIYRDCGSGEVPGTPQMPQLYAYSLPEQNTVWDFNSWITDVVVINLGTNDFSFMHSDMPNKERFVNGYKDLLNTIRRKSPNAHIYVSIGPLLSGDRLTTIKQYLNDITNEFKATGDQKMHFVEFPLVNPEGAWHPSIRQHQDMAEVLINAIRSDLGW